jgi:triosephosphate isomerase
MAALKNSMKKIRKMLIAGNWKMHGTHASISDLLTHLKENLVAHDSIEMAVFPPFIFLAQVQRLLTGSAIVWGAQNVAAELEGAYTGEISAGMLRDFGCSYVVIGHSERRLLYGESDAIIARKIAMAKAAGLCPIMCLGETLEQYESGHSQEVVKQQLLAVLKQIGGVKSLGDMVLAYEPVWAIGTGLAATPEQAQAMHAALRQEIALQDADIARQLRILYGGSLKAASAQSLFAMPDIDGGLIGGASLAPQEFLQIYRHALPVIHSHE